MQIDHQKVQQFVGPITEDQYTDVECYIGPHVAIFVPSTGPCKYAITPEHEHPTYSFLLGFDDYCKMELDGRVIQSKPGKVVAVSPDLAHHEIMSETFPRYMAVLVLRDYFEQQLGSYTTDRFVFKGDVFNCPPDLLTYVKDFMFEFQAGLPGCEALLDAMGLKICHAIIRMILDIKRPEDRVQLRMQIDRVIQFLHAHFSQKLTVDVMAEQAHLSPSHFSRLFKEETGVTPGDYLMRLRLNKAKQMLMQGEKRVIEVALDCGFSSPSHFSTAFQQQYQTTPKKFMDQFRIV